MNVYKKLYMFAWICVPLSFYQIIKHAHIWPLQWAMHHRDPNSKTKMSSTCFSLSSICLVLLSPLFFFKTPSNTISGNKWNKRELFAGVQADHLSRDGGALRVWCALIQCEVVQPSNRKIVVLCQYHCCHIIRAVNREYYLIA